MADNSYPAEKENPESSMSFLNQKLMLFESFADSIEDAILFLENPEKIVFCNDRIERLSGYSKQEFLSGEISFTNIIYEEDIPTFYSALKTVQTNKTVHNETLRFNHKSKSIPINVNLTISRVESEKECNGYTLMFKKISNEHNSTVAPEKKSGNENIITLELLAAKYKAIFDNLNIGIAVVDSSMDIQTANRPLEKLLQFNNHKPKKCYNVFFNRQTECTDCSAKKTFADGEVHKETSNLIVDGEERTFQFTTSPIYDENNNVIKVIKATEDITQKIITEKKVRKFSEELIQLNKNKDRFISILSHDLKQPFNSILGFSDVLINSKDKLRPEKTDKYLRIINQTAQQSYRLLSELLVWAKSQSGNLDIQPETFLFIEISESVINNVASLAKGKSIEIHCLVAEKLYIYADVNIFKIVLRNLLTNAIKFSHPNSDIYIYAEIRNGMTEVTVSDSGVGMDEKEIAGIWDIQKQQSRPGTANENGSGFGLSLCKDLIEKHNGNIWVKSKKNEGSDFTFALPLKTINEK